MRLYCLIICCVIMGLPVKGQKTDRFLKDLLERNAGPLLKKVLDSPSVYQYQVIYTQIDRDKNNNPHFKSWYLNVDAGRYFNPASTVKLPVSLAALEKLNDLKVPGLNKYSSMITDSAFSGQTRVSVDSTSGDGLPSVAHYIKKIFMVSDNDAYNRLYEFNGQKSLNTTLWDKGYKNTRITRRFVSMTEEENRHTNPIDFLNKGQVVYKQPAAFSDIDFDFSRKVLIGKAHFNRDEVLLNEPMDFTKHNNFPLEEQQYMLRSVLFPESVPEKRRFRLNESDYSFLYRSMSELPSQSDHPKYDLKEFFDSYARFFWFRAGKQNIPGNLRIFSKAGWSYGFLIDNAYIIDTVNNIEFMISAVIYVNKDGVLNDNKYEYEETGYPFFKEVGEIIYKNELKRKVKFKPNLDKFKKTEILNTAK